MGKLWRVFPHDTVRIARVQQAAGVSPILAQLLICRGLDQPDQIKLFLDPKLTGLRDPELLPGVTEAADRLIAAVREKRRIIVYGDYDADGMTATAILFRCLTLVGGNVGYFVPNRLDEGYGLNHESLRQLAERGANVIVTVDCGINSTAQAETARELGLELIITDHHEPGPVLPAAAAIVHPRLPGTAYPFAGLCGAGVAFKLAWAVCQRASSGKKVTEALRDYLMQAVGLAALGTVADVVPLLDENRILVRHGTVSLRERPPLGIAALMQLTQLDKKPQLGSEDIAFTLAPRLNAAGRLNQAQLGVELLTTESAERAAALAEYIHQLNSSRESLERSIYLAAQKQIQEQFDPAHEPALVLAGRGWHAGVIGIVAGRLAEKHHRPVVLVALDAVGVKSGVGSARSPEGVNLHAALGACQEHLLGFGGHAAAAGLQIEETSVDAFRAAFCESVAGSSQTASAPAELRIDLEAPFGQLTLPLLQQLEHLSPFGAGNRRPLFCASQVSLVEPPKRIGGGERHLSMKLRQHGQVLRTVGFGLGDAAEELAQQESLDVAFRPVLNTFGGRQSVELQLVDWRPTAKPAPVGAAAG